MKNVKINIIVLSLVLACSVQNANARKFSFSSAEEKAVEGNVFSKPIIADERAPSLEPLMVRESFSRPKPIIADERAPSSKPLMVKDSAYKYKPIIADEKAPTKRDGFSAELKSADYTSSKAVEKKKTNFGSSNIMDKKAPDLRLDVEEKPQLDNRKIFQKELSLEEKAMLKEEAKLEEIKAIKEKKPLIVEEAKKMNKEVQIENNFENLQMKKELQRVKRDELAAKEGKSEFSNLTKKQMFQMVKSLDSSGADFYEKSYTDIDDVNMINDDEVKKYVNDNLNDINVFRGYGARDKQDFAQRVREDERFKREVIEGNNKALDDLSDKVEDATGMDIEELEDISPVKVKDIEDIKDTAGAGDDEIIHEDDERIPTEDKIRDFEKHKDFAREKDLQRYDEIEKRDHYYEKEYLDEDRDYDREDNSHERYDEPVRIDKPIKKDYQRKEFRREDKLMKYDEEFDSVR